ncbi:MAG: hypothetical protein KH135_04640 [Firmicutes bacterium]|nr:hypothetical protein [Bacillota bacterium]
MKNSSNIKQIELLDIQRIASLCYIVTTMVSIFLTTHREDVLKGKDGSLTNLQAKKINVGNHFTILILACVFLYVNHVNLNLAREQGKDTHLLTLQYTSAVLAVIGAILVLYVVIVEPVQNETGAFENPEL